MAKKILNEQQIRELEKLDVVTSVSPSYITFAAEFKEQAVKQYNEGYSGWDIFHAAGFPAELLNPTFITESLKRWRRTVRLSGVRALYKNKKGRPKRSASYKAMSDKEKIAYLEAENAFLVELRARRQANGLQ